jgi:hypothetical protein
MDGLPTIMQESLKDAHLANAGMDDDQMTSSRQVARLKHALEESHTTLKEAQLALDKVRHQQAGSEIEVTTSWGSTPPTAQPLGSLWREPGWSIVHWASAPWTAAAQSRGVHL